MYMLLLLFLLPGVAWAACTTQQLQTEFQTDPAGLNYQLPISQGSDQGVANLINRVWTQAERTGYRVWRLPIPSYEFVNSYDPTEYGALTSDKLAQLNGVVGAGFVDPAAPNTGAIIRNVFPAGGPTRTNLTAIAKVDGSRAQILCSNSTTGYSVTLAEVSKALHQ